MNNTYKTNQIIYLSISILLLSINYYYDNFNFILKIFDIVINNSFLTFLTFCFSIYLIFKLKFLDNFKWYQIEINRIQKMFDYINWIKGITTPQTPSSQPSQFKLHDSTKSVSIVYSRLGQDYLINVPYRDNLVSKMRKYKVYLISTDTTHKKNIRQDITQQAGVMYTFCASDLGGNCIQIVDSTNNQIMLSLDKNEILNEDDIINL